MRTANLSRKCFALQLMLGKRKCSTLQKMLGTLTTLSQISQPADEVLHPAGNVTQPTERSGTKDNTSEKDSVFAAAEHQEVSTCNPSILYLNAEGLAFDYNQEKGTTSLFLEPTTNYLFLNRDDAGNFTTTQTVPQYVPQEEVSHNLETLAEPFQATFPATLNTVDMDAFLVVEDKEKNSSRTVPLEMAAAAADDTEAGATDKAGPHQEGPHNNTDATLQEELATILQDITQMDFTSDNAADNVEISEDFACTTRSNL